MDSLPQDRWPDSTLALLHDPYRFISRRCRRLATDAFEARLLFENTICVTGKDAAAVFYDTERFSRQGAAPDAAMKTLFGVGGVQGLDGEEHRHRKEMFMALASGASVDSMGEAFEATLDEYARHWMAMRQIVVYEQMQEILTRAACEWAGVPVALGELSRRTRQISSLFDHAGSKGPLHFGARLARRQTDRWFETLIDDIRAGRLSPAQNSPAHGIAWHRDLQGKLLPRRVAAVELLNVVRPIVATSVFVTFAVLALHAYPECRQALQADPNGYARPFAQEVRRFYPFFPFVAARVRQDFQWHGFQFPAGRRVLLDLYGTDHDARYWGDPEIFRPERFANGQQDPFAFIPQGGGDHYRNHRCPGEDIVIALLQIAARFFFERIRYDVPRQNLQVNFRHLPALPKSRLRIENVHLNA